MLFTTVLPLVATLLFVAFGFYCAVRNESPAHGWVMPAILSGVFLVFSVVTIAEHGLLGFWSVHTYDLWGNQVWMDLLLAIGIGWFLIVPHAKTLGMRLVPWFVLICFTGCIGFLAMLARYQYLRARVATSI